MTNVYEDDLEKLNDNREFTEDLKQFINQDGGEVEVSSSDTEDDDINPRNGMLIMMSIYLGDAYGNRNLYGNCYDNPAVLARKFAKENGLPIKLQM